MRFSRGSPRASQNKKKGWTNDNNNHPRAGTSSDSRIADQAPALLRGRQMHPIRGEIARSPARARPRKPPRELFFRNEKKSPLRLQIKCSPFRSEKPTDRRARAKRGKKKLPECVFSVSVTRSGDPHAPCSGNFNFPLCPRGITHLLRRRPGEGEEQVRDVVVVGRAALCCCRRRRCRRCCSRRRRRRPPPLVAEPDCDPPPRRRRA